MVKRDLTSWIPVTVPEILSFLSPFEPYLSLPFKIPAPENRLNLFQTVLAADVKKVLIPRMDFEAPFVRSAFFHGVVVVHVRKFRPVAGRRDTETDAFV